MKKKSLQILKKGFSEKKYFFFNFPSKKRTDSFWLFRQGKAWGKISTESLPTNERGIYSLRQFSPAVLFSFSWTNKESKSISLKATLTFPYKNTDNKAHHGRFLALVPWLVTLLPFQSCTHGRCVLLTANAKSSSKLREFRTLSNERWLALDSWCKPKPPHWTGERW